MNSNDVSSFPPISHWGLDPIYWCFCKISIRTIHELVPPAVDEYVWEESAEDDIEENPTVVAPDPMLQGFHFLPKSLRPISRAHVCGIVVLVQAMHSCFRFCVDDGTAVIACVKWPSFENNGGLLRVEDFSPVNDDSIELGDVVCVQGKIDIFRGQRQIRVFTVNKVKDPNHELRNWQDIMLLEKEVYLKPYSIFQPAPLSSLSSSSPP